MVLTIDPIAFYDAQLSRTAKAQDITSSFLTAIEDDKHMLKHKKDIVAEQVCHFDMQAGPLFISIFRSPI